MTKSESIAKLAEALSKAQSQVKGAIKDCTNPFFKASYADLSSVWDACRGPLTDNGLAIIQTTEDQEGLIIETTLAHSSGEWVMGRLKVNPTKNDPQGIGSAITYARRYALAAIVGICPEDDDAEGAMDRGKKEKKSSPATPTPEVPSGEPPATSPPKGKTSNHDFLKAMGEQKKRVGERNYYVVLGKHGFEKSDQITDREIQKKVYNDLKEISAE